MTYLFSALGGIALLVAAFFYGEHVQKSLDAGHSAQIEVKQDARLNAGTATRTLAAATHVQAVQAGGAALRQEIHHRFQPVPAGGTHATLALPDPLDDPAFRLCYDAASTGQRACEAGHVLLRPASGAQPPAR